MSDEPLDVQVVTATRKVQANKPGLSYQEAQQIALQADPKLAQASKTAFEAAGLDMDTGCGEITPETSKAALDALQPLGLIYMAAFNFSGYSGNIYLGNAPALDV